MQIEDWLLAKVKPYPNNPRVLRNAAEKVAESIKSFGWRQPIVVDADGFIIAGHARHAAAKLLKLKTVPVHVASDLSEAQVRALRIADNKTATFADWDDARLADELQAIMAGADTVVFTGFAQSELDAILMRAAADVAAITAAAPVVQHQPAAQPDPAPDATPDTPSQEPEPEPAAASAPAPAGEHAAVQDMVPFHALMSVDARQVVYDAIAKAKSGHGLETTGEALLVISRSYIDA